MQRIANRTNGNFIGSFNRVRYNQKTMDSAKIHRPGSHAGISGFLVLACVFFHPAHTIFYRLSINNRLTRGIHRSMEAQHERNEFPHITKI
jgi:hypothetical protein